MAHAINKISSLLQKYALVFVFVAAFSLRLVGNTQVPASPYWEEVALGYDAYSILQTGKDHHGEAFPIVAFGSFGDFKPSLYFYATVPSIALFGLNTFAVRLPSVLAGAGIVMLLFWLARRWRGERFAWIVAALSSVQPWLWHIGRLGFEVNLAVFFCCLGIVLVQKTFDANPRHNQFLFAITAALAFVAAMYTYHGTRLLSPLFAIASVLLLNDWQWPLQSKSFKKWITLWVPAAFLAALVSLPLLLALRSPAVAQRFHETSLFGTDYANRLSVEMRSQADLNIFLRAISHPSIIWAEEIAKNYLDHFSPVWLFLRGDSNPRHSSQYLGMLYPWEIVTLLFGVAYAQKMLKKKHFLLLSVLTLISPIAAALTTVTPHALRALPLAPWLVLWSALGAEVLLFSLMPKWSRQIQKMIPFSSQKVNVAFFALLLGVSFGILSFFMATQYQKDTALEWQFGYDKIILALEKHAQNGETKALSRAYGRPAMYVWFTLKVQPSRVQAEEKTAHKDQGEFLTFENWTFFDGQWGGGGIAAAPRTLVPEGKTILQTIELAPENEWLIYR